MTNHCLSNEEYLVKLEEFNEIASMLEIPVVSMYNRFRIYKPERMPETEEELLQMVAAGALGDPRIDIRKPARSFTRNMYNLCVMGLCGLNVSSLASFWDGYINIKTPSGSITGNTGKQCYALDYESAYGADSQDGIRLGTGNTAWSLEDYDLDTQIDHGDAAGELRYWGDFAPVITWEGATRQWTIHFQRYFTNHSDGDITVREVGLYCNIQNASPVFNLVARDLLGSPLTVSNHELIRVDYEITSAVFPSYSSSSSSFSSSSSSFSSSSSSFSSSSFSSSSFSSSSFSSSSFSSSSSSFSSSSFSSSSFSSSSSSFSSSSFSSSSSSFSSSSSSFSSSSFSSSSSSFSSSSFSSSSSSTST